MNRIVILTFSLASFFFFGCKDNTVPGDKGEGLHKVEVREVLQTSKYTYLRVQENGSEQWIAVPGTQAAAGETWYYATGFEMKNFDSKELKRSFESVLFIEKISKDPKDFTTDLPQPESKTASEPVSAAEVGTVAGGTSISDLYAKKNEYKDKVVTVKGKVTKVNTGILGKNWFHIEDGTKFGKAFDLTVTSDEFLNMGDIVTFQGKIVLDKDLGSGYFFEVLMEDAVVK
jgi:hypothetical protein